MVEIKTQPRAWAERNAGELMRRTVYDRIEHLLNSGALRPGQMVSQRELVEMTQSTLSSVREAIPRLEAEGLLQTLPKRGLMVPSLDVSFVREAYGLRRLIELEAVRSAVPSLSAATLQDWIGQHERLRAIVEDAADEASSDAVQALDWHIHEVIVGTMGNTLIDNVYRVTAIKIRMAVQSQIRVTPYNASRVIDEHLAFLRPLAQGKVEAARKALGRHIDNSLTLALGGML